MQIGTYISLGALLVSLVALLLNGKKDAKADAASHAVVTTKLDTLINGVDDIRVELRSMRDTLSDHGERLAKVEARAASNTHRLDVLEKLKGGA